jgi:hypothetical protein
MEHNRKYILRVLVWVAAFLIHYVVVHFVMKPAGLTYFSPDGWIVGLFSLGYIVIVTLLLAKYKSIVLDKEVVKNLLLLSVFCAAISIVLVFIYNQIDSRLPHIVIPGTDTPFLWYTYIFPRTAGIIYQQLMFFYLIQLTAKYYPPVNEQSKALSLVLGGAHLPVYLIIPNPYIATSMLIGSFILGYLLPKFYYYFGNKGLYVGYTLHYAYYVLMAPLAYFIFRWVQ